MRILPVLLFLLLTVCGYAENYTVAVKTDRSSGIYRTGETVTVSAVAMENGKPASGLKVDYQLLADGGFSKKGSFVSDAAKPYIWQHEFKQPGALRAHFTIRDRNGKLIPLKAKRSQMRYAGGMIGAVASPEKLLPARPKPADFDRFWEQEKKRLAKVPVKELERIPLTDLKVRDRNKVDVWDIKVACVDDVPVSGYLSMPKKAAPKSLPAILRVQGAGVGSAEVGRVTTWAAKNAICLEINAHGIPNGLPKEQYRKMKDKGGKYYAYYSKIYSTREEHVFRNMALRVVRALEYLKTLPQWDGKNLIIRGASQGGWQAIVGAGMVPDVTLCIAGVPAFADFDGEFSPAKRMGRIHFGGAFRRSGKKGAELQKILDVQAYFDPAFFAGKIRAKTFITVGFMDLSCPTTSVYAIYNMIPQTVSKRITVFPDGVHATCPVNDGDAELEKILQKKK